MESQSKETKKQNRLASLLNGLLKILTFAELASEIRTVNKRLLVAIEIVGDMDGKLKTRNPLKEQLIRNKIILSIIFLIPLAVLTFIFLKFPFGMMTEYLKIIPARLGECIKGSNLNWDYILGKDLIAYYVARSWGILFLVQTIVSVILSKLIIKNSYMISMTKKFRAEALSGGFIKEDGPGELLMTPLGLLIDLESNSEKGFVETDNLWNQLNIYPGKVFNSKNKRTLIFVTIVQPLADSYAYFENNSIEIKR